MATDIDGGAIRASVHFTRARGRVDLQALGTLVRGANEGVLFLMFIPGGSGVLADIRALQQAKPDLLVRGVVSELPKGREDEKTGTTTAVRVTLFGAPSRRLDGATTFDVVQPEGTAHPTAYWAAQTTRRQFPWQRGPRHHPLQGPGRRPVLRRPDRRRREPQLFDLGESEERRELHCRPRRQAPGGGLRREHPERVAALRWEARQSDPNLGGVEYLRALLSDQQRYDEFWQLA
jgi:hypothetical protein